MRCQNTGSSPGCVNGYPEPAGQAPSNEPRWPVLDGTYKQLNCREPNGKQEYEHCQQWRSAEAAEEQACLARRQFWLGIFGVFGLLGTIIYAAKSADAAAQAAASLAHAERAFVKMSHRAPGLKLNEDVGTATARIEIKNFGRTPADVMWVSMMRCIVSRGESLPANPLYEGRSRQEAFLVAEDSFGFNPEIRVSAEELADIRSNAKTMYIYGYVDYRDRMTGIVHRAGYGRLFRENHPGNNLVFVDVPGYNYDRPRLASEDKSGEDEE